MRQQIRSFFINQLIERPGKRKGYKGLSQDLNKHLHSFPIRLQERGENAHNRSKLRHIIGIERWGQQRLRVALGQDYQRDDYHGYKPDKSLSWSELIESYQQTRTETLAIVKELQQKQPGDSIKIEHNQWGPLSIKGWLHYLETHARLEGRRLKA